MLSGRLASGERIDRGSRLELKIRKQRSRSSLSADFSIRKAQAFNQNRQLGPAWNFTDENLREPITSAQQHSRTKGHTKSIRQVIAGVLSLAKAR
jgi:hypothetical protein